jgi:pimeloyl-ACP methyl ester carboxylesterase
LTTRRVEADGVTLAVLDEGEGRPVVLLHGFPDSSYVWRHQVPPLVDAGKRVIAPDLRGFGESDRPEGIQAYGMRRQVGDVVAVLDGLGIGRADIVGHDSGAALAWVFAAFVPDRVERLVALSVGHPNTYRQLPIGEREKWWYQLLFQFEGVAEQLLMQDDWRLMRDFTRGDGDIERWLADLSRPGALTAGLNWYRANSNPEQEVGPREPLPSVAASTLGVWSDGDNYLAERAVVASSAYVTGPWRYERIDGASHWLQLDAPERVNELLLEFLA